MSKYFSLLNSVFRTYKKLINKSEADITDSPESMLVLYYISNGLTLNDIVSQTMYSQSLVLFQCNNFVKRGFLILDHTKNNKIDLTITESGLEFLTNYIDQMNEKITINEAIYQEVQKIESSLNEISNTDTDVIYV